MVQRRTKSYLRKRAKKLRAKAARSLDAEVTQSFFENFLKTWTEVSASYQGLEAILAGYYPMADELDVRPVMVALDCLGVLQCLPEVVGQDQPLLFRSWIPHEELVKGVYGTSHPQASEPVVRPDVVMLPMLAFDRRGARLGWGGGYYDRTLDLLRKTGKVTTIGVAYGCQEVDELPTNDYDQPVDWIITEEQAIKVI